MENLKFKRGLKVILSLVALLLAIDSTSAQNYSFNNNLSLGSQGADVVNLQTFLISSGFDIPSISSGLTTKGYFGLQTKRALVRYQLENGLPGTGFFGPLTRARWNNNPRPIPNPPNSSQPVITGIESSTILSVGQVGTWKVKAYEPNNRNLSYAVDWGESVVVSSNAQLSSNLNIPFIQTSSFTHSYSNPGVYTVRFYVKNDLGHTTQSSVTVRVGNQTGAGPLQMISPNGGEYWQKGSRETIRWTSPYYIRATYADLKLVPYYEPCTGQICPATSQTAIYPYILPYTIASNISINQNSYDWLVGQVQETYQIQSGVGTSNSYSHLYIPDGRYNIQICEVNSNNCESSDSYFTITSNSSSNLLRICPEKKIVNRMPMIYSNSVQAPASTYYILNGQRRELVEFDMNWLNSYCTISEEIVY